MKLPYPIKNGFTLIELMVVVAIIAIVSGITIPTFSRYTKNQSLKQAQELFKSDLRSVQNKALVGTGSDSIAPSGDAIVAWGVYTGQTDPLAADATKYRVFMSSYTGTNSTLGCTTESQQLDVQVYSLPMNTQFVGSNCIIFRMEDGNVSNIGEASSINVVIRATSGSTKTINVAHPGLVRNVD